MKKISEVKFPRIIVMGDNALNQLPDTLEEINRGKNVILVTNDFLLSKIGNKVEKSLSKNGYSVTHYLTDLATEDGVSEVESMITETDTHMILGLGGGNAMDTAKLSASKSKIPYIALPTSGAHDGMASPNASVRVNGQLKSFISEPPFAIVADLKVIHSAPPKLLWSGIGDLLSNYIAVSDWKLAVKDKNEDYSHYAASLSQMSAEVLLDMKDSLDLSSTDTVALLIEGLISSGAAMCIAGSSRPASGSEHLFSHALDQITNHSALHGEQCGVGTIMMAKLHGLDWNSFQYTLKKVGAPTTAKELGIDSDHTSRPIYHFT